MRVPVLGALGPYAGGARRRDQYLSFENPLFYYSLIITRRPL